jgi:predicted AlkP superfamily pyrophosphatase or phosphodiesterase
MMRAVRLCLILLLLLFVMPTSAQEATEVPAPPNVERVIVISLDGTRPDAVLQANTPTLHRLAEEGAVDWEATTTNPSVTLPAHTSMLTGLSVEEHGVTFNDMPSPCTPIEPLTFVSIAADAGYKAAMVVGKEKFCIYQQRETVDYAFAREGDRSVADRVIELLDDDYQVIFAHFPNPDFFGHSTGWMSDTYINELHSTDYQVGRIVAELERLDALDNTLIIITADHGGHDLTHGTTMPEDMHIPWIIFGAGVQPGTLLHGIYGADSAATALWALGLPLPDSAASRPVVEAFG